MLVDKMIANDTGKLKARLSFWEKTQLYSDINNLLGTSHKTSMMSFLYQNE